MKKLAIIFFLTFNTYLFSQNTNSSVSNFIEVIGTAKKEISPNQIYVSITLTEKSIDNKKYSIEAQEIRLRQILVELNVSESKLTLSDFSSTVITQKRKEIGFKQNKEFNLLLESAQEVSNLFDKLFEANIKEAEILKVSHTDIVNLNKEVRIEAVKAAKLKAEYLLEAVGNKIGKPIEIIEFNENENNSYLRSNSYNLEVGNVSLPLRSSEFRKIIITFSYKVKYQIE